MRKRRWFVSFWHDYEPIFFSNDEGRWNWVDWTLIQICFEHANYCERDELTIALLGFHMCIERWRIPVSKDEPKEAQS